MSVEIKFVPLTFINTEEEILRQIKNTVVFSYLFNKYEETTLEHYLASTQYGYTASASAIGKHRLLRITDINYGKVNWENVPFCNCDSEMKYLLQDNDILIARTGGTTGKSFIVSDVPKNAIFASYLIRLRLKPEVNLDFITHFLNSYTFWSQIVEMKSGSAMPNVNAEKLKTLILPKCETSVQNKIVSAISNNGIKSGMNELFKKITDVEKVFNNGNAISTELTHQLTLVKKLRQQLLQDAVQGKLVAQNKADEPASELLRKIKAEKEKLIAEKKLKKEKELPTIKAEEIPFDIPENWTWCRLGEVTDIKRGKSPQYSESGVAKMLNQKCVRWYELDLQFCKSVNENWFNNVSEDFRIRGNDVLVNSTGEGTIGRSAIASLEAEGFIFDSHILKISSTINQMLICYFINSDFGQSLVDKTKGATSTKQTELGVNNLAGFIFPLPPLSEQNRIVQKLDELMQYCYELEASIKESEMHNERLLQQVLREALRVSEPQMDMIK